MTTTHLFVELLVIGFGALIWFLLLLATFFGADVHTIPIDRLDWTVLLFPLLSLSYVLGIVTDRVADRLFSSWEERHRLFVYKPSEFGSEKKAEEKHHNDRRFLLVEGPELWQFIEYGRSRLRICRGWALNGVLLIFSYNILDLFGHSSVGLSVAGTVGLNGLLAFLTGVCVYVWARLHLQEYKKIKRQSKWLRKHRAKDTARQLKVTSQHNLDSEQSPTGEDEP